MGLTTSGNPVRPMDSLTPEAVETSADSSHVTPCVLVVDDDADTRDVLRMALEDESYRVIEAANGCQALALLTLCNTPLVVILDQRMPGLLGTDVLDEVFQVSSICQTRAFILLTASPHRLPPPYSHQRFQHFIPVVGKPMDLEVLLDVVSRAYARLQAGLAMDGNA